MEKTNGQILGTDTSRNEKNKIKIIPKSTIISSSSENFNPLVQYSKHQAQLKQISDTVKDGDCLFDTCYQGIRLHNDLVQQSKCNSARQLRMNVSTWAAQNPNYNIGENLTLIQHLKHQLHLFELPLHAYEKWWELMGSSQRYAESTVLAALAVYLDYDICIWRRQSTATKTMKFACLFSSLSNSRQIHSLLDGKADSVLAADGHFSLIMD